jgi:hypothetical protein
MRVYVLHQVQKLHLLDYPFKQRFVYVHTDNVRNVKLRRGLSEAS